MEATARRLLGDLADIVDYKSAIKDGELNFFYVLVTAEMQRKQTSQHADAPISPAPLPPREKRTRISSPPEDYRESPFWKKFILRTTETEDKEFQACFRLPYDMFLWLVDEAKAKDWFPGRGNHFPHQVIAGVQRKPLELLILSSLAYLAGTYSWKMLQRETTISTSTNSTFFAQFIQHLSSTASMEEWLTPTEAEALESARMFSRAGLEGCWAACDDVNIRLWSCANNLKSSSKSKAAAGEHTTNSFNLACLGNGKIIFCSRAFPGEYANTSLAREDPFFVNLESSKYLPTTQFTFQRLDGTFTVEDTPWCIVRDGGYGMHISTLAPPQHSSQIIDMVLTRWMRSVKTVVQCVFGALKQRWRILKFGITIQDAKLCESAMWAACVLQNMILNWVQTRVREEGREALDEALKENVLLPIVPEIVYTRTLDLLPKDYEFPTRTTETAYEERRLRLAEHFYVMLCRGQAQWPSRKTKGRFPMSEFDLHHEDDDGDPNAGIVEMLK